MKASNGKFHFKKKKNKNLTLLFTKGDLGELVKEIKTTNERLSAIETTVGEIAQILTGRSFSLPGTSPSPSSTQQQQGPQVHLPGRGRMGSRKGPLPIKLNGNALPSSAILGYVKGYEIARTFCVYLLIFIKSGINSNSY